MVRVSSTNWQPIASIFDAAYQLARLLWPTNAMAAPCFHDGPELAQVRSTGESAIAPQLG
jgi:hypothetical protein